MIEINLNEIVEQKEEIFLSHIDRIIYEVGDYRISFTEVQDFKKILNQISILTSIMLPKIEVNNTINLQIVYIRKRLLDDRPLEYTINEGKYELCYINRYSGGVPTFEYIFVKAMDTE